MICRNCQQDMVFKKGVKKDTGKPWAGYFCEQKSGGCGFVEWSRTQAPMKDRSIPKPYTPEQAQTAIDVTKKAWNAEKNGKNEARISALAIVKSLIESGFYKVHEGEPTVMKEKIYEDVVWYENRFK